MILVTTGIILILEGFFMGGGVTNGVTPPRKEKNTLKRNYIYFIKELKIKP